VKGSGRCLDPKQEEGGREGGREGGNEREGVGGVWSEDDTRREAKEGGKERRRKRRQKKAKEGGREGGREGTYREQPLDRILDSLVNHTLMENATETLKDSAEAPRGNFLWREGGREGGRGGGSEVGRYGCQNDRRNEADTMGRIRGGREEGRTGRQAGREGGRAYLEHHPYVLDKGDGNFHAVVRGLAEEDLHDLEGEDLVGHLGREGGREGGRGELHIKVKAGGREGGSVTAISTLSSVGSPKRTSTIWRARISWAT